MERHVLGTFEHTYYYPCNRDKALVCGTKNSGYSPLSLAFKFFPDGLPRVDMAKTEDHMMQKGSRFIDGAPRMTRARLYSNSP
ncbi:hypothetical protein SUGI_0606140 [Cryptomeria japonica]|nr:hypothetical protein SUGI_0606140 [Cryptomeria japonica]